MEDQTYSTNNERAIMKRYWEEHSVLNTLQEMMLDSNAEKLDEIERPEILSLLPPIEGKVMLELASGIGRFTSYFAEEARFVEAVEFMPGSHAINERINGQKENVKCVCADVTTLERPPNSVDFIFSNWLLMYLSDEEVMKLAMKMLSWLKPGGYLFFRESCFKQSGDKARSFNPSHYRHPYFYHELFTTIQKASELERGKACALEIVSSTNLKCYREFKGNHGQVCFLYKKITHSANVAPAMCANGINCAEFQKFLDTNQYSVRSILRYEKIFGAGFVSTGGLQTTEEFVPTLKLKKAERVLDVGCGIGGGAFYMASNYGAHVEGIDLSTNMIHIAWERSQEAQAISLPFRGSGELENKDADVTRYVNFEVCDATKKEYPAESFDVVYSRDAILHIANKEALFAQFFKWLKPGGRLLITDYCCTSDPWSEKYASYVQDRGYSLLSVAEYGDVLKKVGFSQVVAEDRTDQFVDILEEEVRQTLSISEEFIRTSSEEDFTHIIDGWREKIGRCQTGDQKWGLFTAVKQSQPLEA